MTLTHEERRLFDRLDQAVVMATKAAKVVIEGGRALATIRDKQLFVDTASSWEEYLGRHGLTRRRADQLVAAANALDAVNEAVQAKLGTVVPSLDQMTERTARQLVGMDIDSAAEAVIEAASSPEGVTAGSIRKAVAKRQAKAARPVRFRVPGWVIVATPNRKAAGSAVEALAAAMRQASDRLDQTGEAA